MKPSWYRFCKLVCLLDRIPRYGRLYRLHSLPVVDPLEQLFGDLGDGESQRRRRWRRDRIWRYQRNGRWGMNLLSRWGLLWAFIDEMQCRFEERFELGEESSEERDMPIPGGAQDRRETLVAVALGVLLVLTMAAMVLTLNGV